MNELLSAKQSFHGPVQYAWDSTSITAAQTCPRKYYYSMIECIKPKTESVHLLFGGLYAAALEAFYKHRAAGDTIDEALHKVVKQALIDSWNHEAGVPVAFEDVKKTRNNLIRTIIWYVEQFADESESGLQTYHLQTGAPAVELSFTIEASEDIVFRGHLDRVVSMADRLYVMDQKTTGGTVGTYYFRQFDLSNQMSLYSWAGKAILNTPVSGVIIDAAQIAVNFVRFERGITTRTPRQLDEWYYSAMATIKQIQDIAASDAWEDTRRWPMNLSSCGNYGGCPFRILCSVDPSVRASYQKSDFVSHNWDPLIDR